ncbi:SMUG2 DNA glycosylase family protein [Listeria seeligeri]|uniref:uracil-DNA glycosylase family protein n=1 Tax=Listeria seeligeri TaxID=1640 RepID=UPI00188904DE|nr:uracil-DNA glycosylase family protein [Listeria seeligeri]MBF2345596.1 SMUG2 DNA glycosylase family protein [Listeria seeligeri]MBF2599440.1 SMUG2 DNA glycosylase family protein [Listeria seeligeri]
MTFANQILQFNEELAHKTFHLPDGFKVINPYKGNQKQQVKEITTAFYQKYYNDTKPRRIILGSSPARKGSAVTGVPFEDAKHLQSETSIFIDEFYINKSSSGFLYDVINNYGGCEKFYADFYMNFVFPLGLARTNSKGNEVNCNYYENKKLQEILRPFIINTIRSQLDFGIDTSVCYCIGSGENYTFLSQLNDENHFFTKIIPLEHPRFITQYNSKNKDKYMEKYMKALRE